MRVTIHQPAYLPWLGLLSKIDSSDMYICLDHVSKSKGDTVNRNKIFSSGIDRWLTIPLSKESRTMGTKINELSVANQFWTTSHKDSLRGAYRNSLFWGAYGEKIISSYPESEYFVKNHAITSMQTAMDLLDIEKPVVFSSGMDINSTKSQLILDLCAKVGAKEYLSGPNGREYLDMASFKKEGVKVLFHEFNTEYYYCYAHYLLTMGSKRTKKLMKSNSLVTAAWK